MSHLIQKIIIIGFLSFCYALKAQEKGIVKNNTLKTNLELQEKKIVKEAYNLLNKDEDKKAYKIAHQLLTTSKNKYNIQDVHLLLAYYFNKKTLIDSSLHYTQKALKFNTFTNDSLRYRFYSLGYNLLGINNKKRGLFEEAKKWHIKGIEASQKFKETDLYYTHVHGLALIYSNLGDYTNALKLFKQCLDFKENQEIIIGSYINIGSIYSTLKEYDKSNSYLNKAKLLCEKNNNNQGKSVIAISLATNYQSQKKTEKAIILYNEAIKIADKNELSQIAITARLNLSTILLDNKKYEEAKSIFSSALPDAKKLGYLQEQAQIYDNLKAIYIAQNDYKNAFNFTEKSSKIKDSITHLQKDKEINELEVKFRTWQKEKEIKILQIENKAKAWEIENREKALKFLNLQKEINQKRSENKILNLKNSSQKKANEIVLLKKDQLLKMAEINWQKKAKKITLYSFLGILIPIVGLLFLYYQRLKTPAPRSVPNETPALRTVPHEVFHSNATQSLFQTLRNLKSCSNP